MQSPVVEPVNAAVVRADQLSKLTSRSAPHPEPEKASLKPWQRIAKFGLGGQGTGKVHVQDTLCAGLGNEKVEADEVRLQSERLTTHH